MPANPDGRAAYGAGMDPLIIAGVLTGVGLLALVFGALVLEAR